MNRFIVKIITLAIAFIVVNMVLLFAVPKDNNGYLCEYDHKVMLLDTVSQPRIIFIGGSNVAFGIDSKVIRDSLGCNVVNFGMHGGIGIKFPLEDALQFIKKGDMVVLQFEYNSFFQGADGESETFPSFMMATNWRNSEYLNYRQWQMIIQGVPKENVKNLMRLAKFPKKGSLDTPIKNNYFVYAKSGFNEFGDEVSHLDYPSVKCSFSGRRNTNAVNKEFMKWLKKTILLYEKAGAKVIMLPPVCVASHFKESYNNNVADALREIHHPYMVSPISMSLDDSCVFNTGYHVNREGVRQNTAHIIEALRGRLNSSH